MAELLDPWLADDIRRRRCKYRVDEIERELWEGVSRDNPDDLLNYAANLVERRRALEARGTLIVVCGRPGVGRHSVISGARDTMRHNPNVRFCQTMCDAAPGSARRASRLDRLVGSPELTAATRRGEFLASFSDKAGVRWGVPLEVATFLVDAGKRGGRTVVLSGPSDVYRAARAALPCVDCCIALVTCPAAKVRRRRRLQTQGVRSMIGGGPQSAPTSPAAASPDGSASSPRQGGAEDEASPRAGGGDVVPAYPGAHAETSGSDDEDEGIAQAPKEVVTTIDNSGHLSNAVGALIGLIEEEPAPAQLPLHLTDEEAFAAAQRLAPRPAPPGAAAGGGRAAALNARAARASLHA
eukprot:TRINITY_DN1936_c0_g2_i1.p1 TRINITY_DN1936_c0_g2~~TRINITY_DN1936_c0_g2_i1.p1  ORF type:complete len:378 (+),score=98.88 TRINITY_DN1936_c0_g2_i1:73-1134(+)